MAIRSLVIKIGAETSSIDKALEQLGSNAKKTDAELKKLGNTPLAVEAQKSFAQMEAAMAGIVKGQERLAEKSALTARGIEQLGGVTKLTKKELDEMARTVETGLDAFRALGQEAPKDVQKVAAAIQQQQKALQQSQATTTQAKDSMGLLGKAQGLLTAQLVAFAGPAALGLAIKKSIDYASALTDMSARTGISTTGLQRLEAVAKASGSTLEQVSSAVNRFQKGLVEGDLDRPITRLGLSIDALRAQSPDEQFLAIARAVKQIEDPAERARTAMELFGKSGAELLPTLTADVDALADSTFKMSEGSIQALDDFGDTMLSWGTSTVNILGEMAAGAITALARMKELADFSPPKAPTGAAAAAGAASFDAMVAASDNPAATRALFGSDAEFEAYRAGIWNRIQRLESGITPKQFPGQAPTFGPSGVPAADMKAATQALTDGLKEQTAAAEKAAAAQKKLQDAYEAAIANIRDAERALKTLTAAQLADIRALHDAQVANQDIAAARRIGLREVNAFVSSLDALEKIEQATAEVSPLGGWITLVKPTAEAVKDLVKALEQVGPLGGDIRLIKPAMEDLSALTFVGPMQEFRIEAQDAGKDVSNLARAFAQVAQVSGDSFGGALQDVARFVTLVDTATQAMKGLTTATSRLQQATSVLGLIGVSFAGMDALDELIHGENRAALAATGARRAFIYAAGGIDVLAERARRANRSLDELMAARTPGQVAAAIAFLNKGFQEQEERLSAIQTGIGGVASAFQAAGSRMPAALRETIAQMSILADLPPEIKEALDGLLEATAPNMQAMQQRAAEFGITLEALGPQFQQADIDRRAQEIVNLFGDLTEAGGNAGGVLAGMADEVSALVNNAIRFGVALPESLRPIVEELQRAGRLTNEAGDKLEDLSGVTFRETPLDKSTNAIVDAIRELGDLLRNLPGIAGQAAQGITDEFARRHPKLIVDVETNRTGGGVEMAATGGLVTATGIQHFGSGGRVLPFIRRGTDSVPAMLTPGELVLNAAQQQAIASGLTGGFAPSITVLVQNNADITTITDEHRMARRVSKAIMSEVGRAFKRGA